MVLFAFLIGVGGSAGGSGALTALVGWGTAVVNNPTIEVLKEV